MSSLTPFKKRSGPGSNLRAMAAGALWLAGATPLAQAASLPELATQVDQVSSQLKNAEDNLRVVETQYTERAEPSVEEALQRRFNEGEIQYLLGDFGSASVFFYDLVADKRFKGAKNYAKALYFLADALYQQQNFIGAKLYLRELLALKADHYKDALRRYLEIAGRLNEFNGIEEYIAQARQLSPSGDLEPEIAYVYGKWQFKRSDLPRDERLRRAEKVFAPMVADPNNPFRLQAEYFLGVSQVQLGELDKAKRKELWAAAIERFKRITADQTTGERALRVRELANLSLGRVLYELGGEEGLEPKQRDVLFTEALDRYQEIPRESEYFVDSLYEIAWVHVRKGHYEKAKNATDILLLVAPDSTMAPEAQILQGHLLLKLQRYGEANDTYNLVINTYDPVYEEVKALLQVHKDPVAYFDNLLAKNERNLDVASLLPQVALKWATTQREVADAVRMVNDLEQGRRGVGEAEEIAHRVLKAIDERGLETFPALQEGYTRADAVDTALAQVEQALVQIEGLLVESQLSSNDRAALDRLRAQTTELKTRMASLPTTEKEVEARRQRMQSKVDSMDKDAFKLGYEVQSMQAIVTAVEKWLDDTKALRKGSSPQDEKEFALRLRHEVESLSALAKDLEDLRQVLAQERASADAAISGESQLRGQLEALLKQQHQLIATAESKLPGDSIQVLRRAHDARERNDRLRERVAAAKKILRDQVTRRGKLIRDSVSAEQALLSGYGAEVTDVSGNARNLVGRIAFDSFKRVRQQFYDLVLKANVGIVDVAFTRKQDKTSQIQKLSSQKDRELRALDEEFKEVLKDVD